jgi:hypothetical protein
VDSGGDVQLACQQRPEVNATMGQVTLMKGRRKPAGMGNQLRKGAAGLLEWRKRRGSANSPRRVSLRPALTCCGSPQTVLMCAYLSCVMGALNMDLLLTKWMGFAGTVSRRGRKKATGARATSAEDPHPGRSRHSFYTGMDRSFAWTTLVYCILCIQAQQWVQP